MELLSEKFTKKDLQEEEKIILKPEFKEAFENSVIFSSLQFFFY